MKRIGIMGGTLDPVHNGHILLGQQAYTEYKLDEIWYMPSHIPPHKKDHAITDSRDRLNMLYLAVDGIPGFCVSEFELGREGNTYTAHTLELLKKEYPDVKFYFIIGADSLFQIEKWYHPEKVMALASLLLSGRRYETAERTFEQQIHYLKGAYGADIQVLHNEIIDVASADIRDKVRAEKDISHDVPKKVAEYIVEHELYR